MDDSAECSSFTSNSGNTKPENTNDLEIGRPIKKLSSDVVNRIAAGEVIQRPANAIKELLENSLDASSTHIQIALRAGGLKMMQIQDNGCGIRADDLPILCERFTTSKLHEFSDLGKLGTFGFRGEALASLSHVSLLTVTTRTVDEKCAHRLSYRNGKPVGKAAACAGNFGTTILAEDLFHNAPMRKAALRNPREEFSRVVEVVSQYAIHNATKCGFHLRAVTGGSNASGSDLHTSAGWSRMDAVRVVMGSVVAQNLVSFSSCQSGTSDTISLAIERLGLRYEGLLTTPTLITSGPSPSLKLNLFINNRMVECTPIKRALESSYSSVVSRSLVRGPNSPALTPGRWSSKVNSTSNSILFVYLNIQLPCESLDVNVHPTKAEVHFLHEDAIITALQDAVEHCLLSCAQVRSFLTRPLTEPFVNKSSPHSTVQESGGKFLTPVATKPQETVRVDHLEQRLDKFLTKRLSTGSGTPITSAMIENREKNDGVSRSPDLSDDPDDCFSPTSQTCKYRVLEDCQIKSSVDKQSMTLTALPMVRKEESPCTSSPAQATLNSSSSIVSHPSTTERQSKRRSVRLHSIISMRRRIIDGTDLQARRILRSSKFVGVVDCKCFLVQHSTDLILVHLQPLLHVLFYQLMLFNFANHGEMILSEPAPIKDLLEMGLSVTDKFNVPSISTNDAISLLSERAPMLWDYFSLRIQPDPSSSNGQLMLYSLPLLLNRHVPNMDLLPIYLLRLATMVDWSDETKCFHGICDVTAEFYSSIPNVDIDVDKENAYCSSPMRDQQPLDDDRWKWTIEYILWPSIVNSLLPGPNLIDEPTSNQGLLQNENPNPTGRFHRIARLSDLYKVFERC